MKNLIVVRGGGELGSAIACCLHRTGFRVLILEQPQPTAIRRRAASADAVARGEAEVERLTCHCVESWDEAKRMLKQGEITLLTDPEGKCISWFKPNVVIDAITASKPVGTNQSMAPFTLALGPGYCAGRDVDVVVDTSRGHNLGRLVREGYASKNHDTAAPTEVDTLPEHIVTAPVAGRVEMMQTISMMVKQGDLLARIHVKGGQVTEVRAPLAGVLRGSLPHGSIVAAGDKIADINTHLEQEDCFTVSDKARCISGSVLEAVVAWSSAQKKKFRFF